VTTPEFPELERLQMEMAEDTVASQHRAMHNAIVAAGPVELATRWVGIRRWVVGLVIGIGVLAPATAFAADSAGPGDFLYPVKKAAEPVLGWFKQDIAAVHRVEELESVVNDVSRTGEVDDRIVRDAVEAVADSDSLDLIIRLDAVLDEILATARDTSNEDPATQQPPGRLQPTATPGRTAETDVTPPGDGEPTPVSTRGPERPTRTPESRPSPTPETSADPVVTVRPEPTVIPTADRSDAGTQDTDNSG
jgi:hypothetical protein